LDAVRDNLSRNHTLMKDLDSTTAGYAELAGPTANAGKGWQPIKIFHPRGPITYIYFMGTLNGQGYKICDLYINRPDEDFVALFGGLDGAVIRDVGVVNATVIGRDRVGGLAGGISGGAVSNSYSSGVVTGNDDVGGLAGYTDSIVADTYSIGSVTGHEYVGSLVGQNLHAVSSAYSAGSVTGTTRVGGLVGYNYDFVGNSYSTSSVMGHEYVGGLVGDNWDTASSSYSTGSVAGDYYVGDLVGSGVVSNCFWDHQTSGRPILGSGTPKTAEEMKNIATFTDAGWNITAVASPGTRNSSCIWNIVNGVTYPFLSWQGA
jgi:hypothetical protein